MLQVRLMQIEVMFFGRPRELAGTSGERTAVKEGACLRDLFDLLGDKYGPAFSFELRRIEGLIIFINGRDYRVRGGVDAKLSDGDTVAILPVVTGG